MYLGFNAREPEATGAAAGVGSGVVTGEDEEGILFRIVQVGVLRCGRW